MTKKQVNRFQINLMNTPDGSRGIVQAWPTKRVFFLEYPQWKLGDASSPAYSLRNFLTNAVVTLPVVPV